LMDFLGNEALTDDPINARKYLKPEPTCLSP
jgi:hypothetical protein